MNRSAPGEELGCLANDWVNIAFEGMVEVITMNDSYFVGAMRLTCRKMCKGIEKEKCRRISTPMSYIYPLDVFHVA